MGELKLSVLEEQMLEDEKRAQTETKKEYYVGNCHCPCWAFLHSKKSDGAIPISDWDEDWDEDDGSDDEGAAASWNID